jgi:hypothetical protein
MNGGMASSCHLWVLMGCRWSAAAPPGPGAGGAAPRCSRHSSGRRGDRLPARSPGPVREHRDRSREQCRCGGDQGDLDLDSRYWPISGTACPAVTLPVLAISAASSRRQTSTRPGNCTASACTATITGRLGWNTLSWCACLKRCREPHGPGGMCGCTSCAVPDRISRSVTGRCSRCWARTWIMPTWMPSDAATRSPGSLPGRRTCCTWYPPGTPTPRSPGGWAYPAHPPGEHLRTAARLQPHRRRHPRLPRPGRLGLTGGRGNVSWPSALALAGLIPRASGRRVRPMACDARRTAWTWQP